MSMWFYRSVGAFAVAGCLCTLAAFAGVRAAGESFVYELTVASTIKEDLSSLPASVRGAAEANLAAANKTPASYVVTLTADRVDPDGSAHVNVGFTNSLESGHGSAEAYAQFNRFDATLTADGRFVPKYDPNMPMTVGARGMSPPEEIHNTKAGQMAQLFADFNIFARGCAARPHAKAGDAWQITDRDRYGIQRTYAFGAVAGAATGAPTVAMKGSFSSANSSSAVSASGHYDGRRGLVLDLHEETTFQNSPPSGVSSSGTTVADYTLRPS
jgi:hypothetical protein